VESKKVLATIPHCLGMHTERQHLGERSEFRA
jgi:hypothetical protein